MEGRNYILPHALTLTQNTPPSHFAIKNQHRQIPSLLIENQQLSSLLVSLEQSISAAQSDLRSLSAVAGKIETEKDAEVREVYDKFVKMENEVKSIDEMNVVLVKVLIDLKNLRLEKKELDEKLDMVRGDIANLSLDWELFRLAKEELEIMKKEIQRGRGIVEHEKRVLASNIDKSRLMEKFKKLMAREIEKLKVEVIDSRKRARAAAALEDALVPGWRSS